MRSFGTLFVRPFFTVFEIKAPGIIGAGNHAVPASYAPVVIHNDNAVIALIGSLNGTDLSTRGVLAVVAEQDHGFFGGLGADFAFDADFPDPVDIPSFVFVRNHVVLVTASVDTRGAARPALIEVNDHPPFPTGRWYIDSRPGCAGCC